MPPVLLVCPMLDIVAFTFAVSVPAVDVPPVSPVAPKFANLSK